MCLAIDPVKFRIVQIKHRKGLRSWIAGSDAREFDIENRIGAVTSSPSRACVHNACSVYIAPPSP